MTSKVKKANKLFILLILLFITTVSFAKTVKQMSDDPENICLAKALYYEARGEPELGKKAVAKIVLNRKEHKKFPKTICKVINQVDYVKGKKLCQFSWVCTKQKINTSGDSWKDAKILSESILANKVSLPKFGPNVLFFKSVYVRHSFGKGYKLVSKIGKSNFYENI
jgi:spore germination cell wall hydrolase CwlJ-like protein